MYVMRFCFLSIIVKLSNSTEKSPFSYKYVDKKYLNCNYLHMMTFLRRQFTLVDVNTCIPVKIDNVIFVH